jgi:hypothetical protein
MQISTIGTISASVAVSHGITDANIGIGVQIPVVIATIDNTDSPYDQLETNGMILCDTTSGSITINLLPAADFEGKRIVIKKTIAANSVTIVADGSETIDGAATRVLYTLDESYTLISDGADWYVIEHDIPSVWTSYTPTFTGFGTVSAVSFMWRRVGDCIELKGIWTAGTCTAVAGEMTLPSGITTHSSVTTGPAGTVLRFTAFNGQLGVMAQPSVGYVNFYSSAANNPGPGTAPVNGNGLLANNDAAQLYASGIKIAGWEP